MQSVGYKWIRDRVSDVYIAELLIFNKIEHQPGWDLFELRTTDCIVKKILRFRDGMPVHEITFSAYFPFTYRAGERITGTELSYCPSLDKLIESQKGGIKYALYLYDRNQQGIFTRASKNSLFRKYFDCLINLSPCKGKIPGLTDSFWQGIRIPPWANSTMN